MEHQNNKQDSPYVGAKTPDEALSYMKSTPNLLILDVREDEWYNGYSQFQGNVHIPKSQLAARYKELPANRPIIINCGAGVVAPQAYEILRKLQAHVMELSYIAGTPLFAQYNNWLGTSKQ